MARSHAWVGYFTDLNTRLKYADLAENKCSTENFAEKK